METTDGRTHAMGDGATGARPTRIAYERQSQLNAFYVGRGAPLALSQASTSTASGAVIDDVTYACATAEGGVALVRSRTTTTATTTSASKGGKRGKRQKTVAEETSVTSSVSELARYDGDEEALTSIAIDRSGRKVFCANRSGHVTRLEYDADANALRRLKTWQPHKSSPVLDMAIDNTGSLLCTGSADRTARVWDIERGYCTHALRGGAHGGALTAVAFHPSINAARVYTAAEDGSLCVWSLNDKKNNGLVKSMADAHVSAITAIRVDVESNTLLTAGRDKIVRTFELDTLKPRTTTAVHETIEDCVIIDGTSPIVRETGIKAPVNGGVVFAVSGDCGRLCLWREGAAKASVESAPLVAKKLTKGGDDVDDDFEAAAGTFTKCAITHRARHITAVSGDARLLTYGVNDATKTLEIEREIVANTDEIIGLAFVRDATDDADEDYRAKESAGAEDDADDDELTRPPKQMAVVTNSPTVRVFDPSTMSCVGSLTGHSAVVLCVDSALTTSGTSLIITGAKDHSVRVWDGSTKACVAVGEGHVGAVAAVAFPPKSSKRGAPFAISGGADRVLRVWDIDGVTRGAGDGAGELHATAATVAHDKPLNGVAIAPHLRMVATCSSDKTAKLWRMPDLVPVATLRGHRRGVWACAFSPSDRILATAGGDKLVKIWSVDDRAGSDTNGTCLRTLEGHTAAVLTIRFLSRGAQVVTTSGDGMMNLWTVNAGACVSSIDAHDDKAWAVCVGGDGDWIATGGTDASMSLWRDTTAMSSAEAAAKHALAVQSEQEFFNAERQGDVTRAIDLALRLERPGALLRVLTRLLEDDYEHGDERLRECLAPLRAEKLTRVMQCVREWNTNSRTSHVAQHVLAAVFRTHDMAELSKVRDIKAIIQGIKAYTERHQARCERLYRGTFLVDTLLASGGSIMDDEETVHEVKRTHETLDDFGYMRATKQHIDEDEDEEEVDEQEVDEQEVDEENVGDEGKEVAKNDVRDADVIKVPKALARLSTIKRGAADIEAQRRKALRDPSPRHTRSGKRL